jgi:hypothetical protein
VNKLCIAITVFVLSTIALAQSTAVAIVESAFSRGVFGAARSVLRENWSFAPLGLVRLRLTHGLRRGLHSYAASRLKT